MILKSVIVEQESKDRNSIRLNDLYVEAVKKLPDGAKAPYWITQKTVSGNADNKDYVSVGNACHEIYTGKPNALLYRKKTYLKVLDESGAVQYVALHLCPSILRKTYSYNAILANKNAFNVANNMGLRSLQSYTSLIGQI